MRKHRRRQLPGSEPLGAEPSPAPPDLAEFLIFEAAFSVDVSSLQLSTCQVCGRPIGFCETIATAVPHRQDTMRICWCCMTAILIFRGAVDLAAPRSPDVPIKGTVDLDFAVSQVLRCIERVS